MKQLKSDNQNLIQSLKKMEPEGILGMDSAFSSVTLGKKAFQPGLAVKTV